MDKRDIIGTATVLAIITVGLIYRKKIAEAVTYATKYVVSGSTEANLQKLHQAAYPKFKKFASEVEKLGWKINFVSICRSFQKSVELYKLWESNPNKYVKPAQPGLSMHNYCMAIDINASRNGQTLTSQSSKQQWIDSGIVAIAKKHGIRWGGDFSNNFDPVHFDLGNDFSVYKLKEKALAQYNNDLSKVDGKNVKV